MQTRIAVEALIASSPRTRAAAGNTRATGSRANRMIRSPITAFQKPTTVQGSVTANSASNTQSSALHPPGESSIAASHRSAAVVETLSAATRSRRAVTRGFADPVVAVQVRSSMTPVPGSDTLSAGPRYSGPAERESHHPIGPNRTEERYSEISVHESVAGRP